MVWAVKVGRKAAKQLEDLPLSIQKRFDMLAKELESAGPLRANWRNFRRLRSKETLFLYHCHLKNGHPTYVACWEVLNKEIRLIEVYYVGTHEKAPY